MVEAGPEVLNHNIESVPRLYRVVRSGARYERTLRLLEYAKEVDPKAVTKSGVMVGLGEEMHELLQVYRDLAAVGCDVLTIGQYLRPSKDHLPMTRYYTPDEFARSLRLIADGEVDAASLVTARVGVDGVVQAFSDLANPEAHTKIIVEPWR